MNYSMNAFRFHLFIEADPCNILHYFGNFNNKHRNILARKIPVRTFFQTVSPKKFDMHVRLAPDSNMLRRAHEFITCSGGSRYAIWRRTFQLTSTCRELGNSRFHAAAGGKFFNFRRGGVNLRNVCLDYTLGSARCLLGKI